MKKFFLILLGTLKAALATADGMMLAEQDQRIRSVIALQGGYAFFQTSRNTESFIGTDEDVFTYTNFGAKNSGFIGAFLGLEHPLSWANHPFFMQFGVEYNYFGKTGIQGSNTVGIEPATSTAYGYNYNVQTQQVLGMFRFFNPCYTRFYPYAELGLGGAFTHSKGYHATSTETGSLNLTPNFNDGNKTSFSYGLGLGVDAQMSGCIRIGLGYRFSHFGSQSLGSGMISFNNYQAPVAFVIGGSKVYANQLVARISYLI